MMIYVTGSNGLIGTSIKEKIEIIPVTYREVEPEITFEPCSTLIHLATSITSRSSLKEIRESFNSDVLIPLKIFRQFLTANPNGKIIFLSTAGDLHSYNYENNQLSTEDSLPVPKTLYGAHKLLVENHLNLLHLEFPNFTSLIFRVSNVYGAKVEACRVNGLVDKLITSNDEIKIFVDLNTTINLIHIDDLVNLLFLSLGKHMIPGHYTFLVGNESYKISDILNLVSKNKKIKITVESTPKNYSYINLDCTNVKKFFNWTCNKSLIDII